MKDKRDDIRARLIRHYQNVDPHEKVADFKQSFFDSALDYLSTQFRNEKISILDVGCGYGYFLELAKKRGWHTSGVEIASNAVQGAREKVGEENIFRGPLKEAHYPANSFVAITLWDVLVMMQDPFEELRECYRIMKNGGKIGIRVRNVFFQKMAYRAFFPFKKISSRLGIKNPYVLHRYCFSSKSIYQLLLRVGFTNIRITNSPLTKGDPYGHTKFRGLVKAGKGVIDLFSRFVFRIGSARWIIGPSLLIWAERPSSPSE